MVVDVVVVDVEVVEVEVVAFPLVDGTAVGVAETDDFPASLPAEVLGFAVAANVEPESFSLADDVSSAIAPIPQKAITIHPHTGRIQAFRFHQLGLGPSECVGVGKEKGGTG